MPKKIDEELKARAVGLVNDHRGEYSSLTAASAVVAKQLGVGKESVRRWVLQHHAPAPPARPVSPRFEQWIDTKLDGLPDEVRQPVQHFATWHHLRRVRAEAAAEAATRGPVHSAKQEITETVKFLLWLHETYQRTASTCTQQDVDDWLATGPTTRTAIRTFFVVATKSRLNIKVNIQHRSAKTSPSLSQDH